MRYLLGLTSLSILATFSILLATAEEPTSMIKTETQTTMETAKKEVPTDTCVDEKGVSHMKGQVGHAACLKAMKHGKNKLHQMGGEAARDVTPDTKPDTKKEREEEKPNRSDMY
ncbi:hypothetical protein WDW86_04090 [Bdellovibrionota bacterium FG-2]